MGYSDVDRPSVIKWGERAHSTYSFPFPPPTMGMDDSDRFILLASLWIVYTLALLLIVWAALTLGRAVRLALHNTALNGPPRSVWPCARSSSTDMVKLATTYGAVFRVPTGLISGKIVICDPTAIAHFYANAPAIYRSTDFAREWTKNLVGRGLTWADGERHPSHRQALAPMFNSSAVNGYCAVFFEMVYKVRGTWSRALESRPHGMRRRLDSIGLAGFGHDFESLRGDYCTVTAAFYTLRAPVRNYSLSDMIFRLAATTPYLRAIPTAKNRIINDFHAHMSRIAGDVLERNSGKNRRADKSVLGLLMKSLAEDPAGEFRLSHAEVLAQARHTGFETTAVSLSWLLVELTKNPAIQEKLRHELHQVKNPTYSQLAKLPFLHAVVYEALRLHPPKGGTTRVAAQDDIIPLSSPILTKSGETATSIRVAKGTVVVAPIRHLNTSETFWGPGALKFDPGRCWQDKSNVEFPGNRHLAFGDGPRACIGTEFALSLIKIVLSGLVGNFMFALPEGLGTIVESTGEGVPQPRVAGQGTELLMVVRRL
ncbi:cytochrome P450 [Mycena metata]|uniref:Cytochrome P450 n=1 Tax=Mycena metata TaxID=1033252 RepID=A0AAD7N0S2_9AGAR|nr:cytochrome P450 [Mycena metata]